MIQLMSILTKNSQIYKFTTMTMYNSCFSSESRASTALFFGPIILPETFYSLWKFILHKQFFSFNYFRCNFNHIITFQLMCQGENFSHLTCGEGMHIQEGVMYYGRRFYFVSMGSLNEGGLLIFSWFDAMYFQISTHICKNL